MVYVRSKKFCCCLPVRFGVFVMSLGALIGGGFVAVIAWIQVTHLKANPLPKDSETSLYVYAALYTIISFVGAFGLIGAIGKKRALVQIFGALLNISLGLSVLSGAFAIYAMFKNPNTAALAKCVNGSTRLAVIDACKTAIKVSEVLITFVYIGSWLFQLYGCIIVHHYVQQLEEETDVKDMERSKASMGGPGYGAPMAYAVPVPAPSYPFTQPVQTSGSQF